MDIKNILSKTDHTLLSPAATWEDIKLICDEGIKYKTASICIPPSFVKRAYKYVNGSVPICTVIGFPNGYSTTSSKCFEAEDAVLSGAGEIDMVINIGTLKEKRFNDILKEINSIKHSCSCKILKVIIETCLLTNSEKIEMCKIISESDANFIKTSTGFSKGGATREDISLFKKYIQRKKIKAAGGISSIKDAEDFINLGADRLGTSRIIKIINNMK